MQPIRQTVTYSVSTRIVPQRSASRSGLPDIALMRAHLMRRGSAIRQPITQDIDGKRRDMIARPGNVAEIHQAVLR